MDEVEKLYHWELLELSIQSCHHEDTLLLLLTLNNNEPLHVEELLDRMNYLFRKFKLSIWTIEDLMISKGLLYERGLIEPDG